GPDHTVGACPRARHGAGAAVAYGASDPPDALSSPGLADVSSSLGLADASFSRGLAGRAVLRWLVSHHG
ncbi:hypothetical protein, partial [Streptomyces sp. NPDC003487]